MAKLTHHPDTMGTGSIEINGGEKFSKIASVQKLLSDARE
jgi:hypothetical protein